MTVSGLIVDKAGFTRIIRHESLYFSRVGMYWAELTYDTEGSVKEYFNFSVGMCEFLTEKLGESALGMQFFKQVSTINI